MYKVKSHWLPLFNQVCSHKVDKVRYGISIERQLLFTLSGLYE
jgi:hypothetical protein